MTTSKARVFGCSLLIMFGVSLVAQAPATNNGQSFAPQHPATSEQVHEFYQLAGMQKLLQQLVKQMLDSMRLTSANSVPVSVWEQMQGDFDKYDFEKAIIPAYQRYVSEEDMAISLAYMKSDAARRMKANEPYIQQMIGDVSRAAGRAIGEKAARDHMGEIQALQKSNDEAAAARVKGKSREQPTIVVPATADPR